jgi:hypothetical protein
VPTFTPSASSSAGLDVFAAAALGDRSQQSETGDGALEWRSLHKAVPYTPSAAVPPKVVKKLLALEYVEMCELRADIWPEEPAASDTSNTSRHPSRPPVTSIRTWLECYGRMAAVFDIQVPGEGGRTLGISNKHRPRGPHLRGRELGGLGSPLSA